VKNSRRSETSDFLIFSKPIFFSIFNEQYGKKIGEEKNQKPKSHNFLKEFLDNHGGGSVYYFAVVESGVLWWIMFENRGAGVS